MNKKLAIVLISTIFAGCNGGESWTKTESIENRDLCYDIAIDEVRISVEEAESLAWSNRSSESFYRELEARFRKCDEEFQVGEGE